MADIKLTPEMKAKIEEAKKTVSELSPDDLDGVASGAGSVVRIYISDSNIKDNIDELIRIHKDMEKTIQYTIDFIYSFYLSNGIKLMDIESYVNTRWYSV